MSDHANNVKAFISLLDNQPSLFDQHRDDLNQLSYSCGEDIETVSDAIALWCKSHPKIREELIIAYSQLPEIKSQPLPEQARPFGGKVEPLQPSDQNEMLVTTVTAPTLYLYSGQCRLPRQSGYRARRLLALLTTRTALPRRNNT